MTQYIHTYLTLSLESFRRSVERGIIDSTIAELSKQLSEKEIYEALTILLEHSLLSDRTLGNVSFKTLNTFFELNPTLSLSSPEGSMAVRLYLMDVSCRTEATPDLEKTMALLETYGFSWLVKTPWSVPSLLAGRRIMNHFKSTPNMIWIQSQYEARKLNSQLPENKTPTNDHLKPRL